MHVLLVNFWSAIFQDRHFGADIGYCCQVNV
ncbi:MAG: hypothetical protein JWN30_2114, partial [Bacilli bacterium]|nr:hypothetical protein [Bacilli bacterium]